MAKKWTEEERGKLRAYREEGLTIEHIADKLGRSPDSIDHAVRRYKVPVGRSKLTNKAEQVQEAQVSNLEKLDDKYFETLKKKAKTSWKINKTQVKSTKGKKSFTTYLVIGDCHVPEHNMTAIKSILYMMDDIKFDGLVNVGDYMDFGSISHWNKTKKLTSEGMKLKQDYIAGNAVLDEFDKRLPQGADKHFMFGNHEDWYYQFLEYNPMLEGMLHPTNELHLKERGYKVYETYNDIFRIGQLNFTHGIYTGMNYVKKHIDELKTNVIFGHLHCAAEDTEILTDTGWKTYKQVSKKDKVATYNLDKHKVEYQNPLNINSFKYKGDMLNFIHPKHGSTDQLVTPNHKMVLSNRNCESSLRIAKDIVENDRLLINTYRWDYPILHTFENNSWAELVGYILGDGWYDYSKYTNKLAIHVSQRTSKKTLDYTRNLLKRCNLKYTMGNYKLPSGEKMTSWRISFTNKKNLGFLDFMNSHVKDKKLNRLLVSLPKKQLRLLLKGLIQADGHVYSKTYSNFVQKDLKTMKLVEELCLKLCKKTTTREIISGFGKKCYIMHIKSVKNITNITTVIHKKDNIKKVKYDGVVWCPETANGTWIARRNGTVFITGNSQRERYEASPAKQLSIGGYALGCLCSMSPGYMKNKPNKWTNGFAVVYFYPNGDFEVRLIRIIRGKFIFDGKVYNGNR